MTVVGRVINNMFLYHDQRNDGMMEEIRTDYGCRSNSAEAWTLAREVHPQDLGLSRSDN